MRRPRFIPHPQCKSRKPDQRRMLHRNLRFNNTQLQLRMSRQYSTQHRQPMRRLYNTLLPCNMQHPHHMQRPRLDHSLKKNRNPSKSNAGSQTRMAGAHACSWTPLGVGGYHAELFNLIACVTQHAAERIGEEDCVVFRSCARANAQRLGTDSSGSKFVPMSPSRPSMYAALFAQAPLGDATRGSFGNIGVYSEAAALALATDLQLSRDRLYACRLP